MGINAESEEILINAAVNTSTCPANHQIPTVDYWMLVV